MSTKEDHKYKNEANKYVHTSAVSNEEIPDGQQMPSL